MASAWLRKLIAFGATAILVSCGQNAAVSPPSGGATGSQAVPAGARGCPDAHCIVVANGERSDHQRSGLLFFAQNARGDAPPVFEIVGSKTKLKQVAGVAVDSQGDLYVANGNPRSIEVFADGARGNVAPIRSIAGSATKLGQTEGLAIDGQGYLYAANENSDSIVVYAPNANGNAAPVRVISGNRTGLKYPWGLGFDSSGNLYASNRSSVTVYAPAANGDVKPLRRISGPNTKLDSSAGLAVDDSGQVYDVGQANEQILVYAPGADGDASPVRVISVAGGPEGIAVDGRQRIYVNRVGYDDPPDIAVIAAGGSAHGIGGTATRLHWPIGILVR
jgi:hypothetical protein